MRLRVTVFAQLKDYFEPGFSIELEDSARVADALSALAKMNPDAQAVLDASRVAIDEEIAAPDQSLRDGQELFILPPASGG